MREEAKAHKTCVLVSRIRASCRTTGVCNGSLHRCGKTQNQHVTQIKSKENCGYNAIQLGYLELEKTSKVLTKPELGHLTKVNLPPFRYLKEYPITEENYEIGHKVTVDIFKVGQEVNVSGLTIGKGNTGNIKEHNFSRGPMAHGSKHHRLQGSLGAGTTPGRVFPGKRMPGRVGMEKRTILGLEIIDIDTAENLLVIKGSVPGKAGNLVSINIS
jgi:large subunit ribosomal protein L3